MSKNVTKRPTAHYWSSGGDSGLEDYDLALDAIEAAQRLRIPNYDELMVAHAAVQVEGLYHLEAEQEAEDAMARNSHRPERLAA